MVMSELPESIDRMVGFWVRNVPYYFDKIGDGDDWTAYSRVYKLESYQDEIQRVLEKIQARCSDEYVKQYFRYKGQRSKVKVAKAKAKMSEKKFVEGHLADDTLIDMLQETKFVIQETYTSPLDVNGVNRIEAFIMFCATERVDLSQMTITLDIDCIKREAKENNIKIDYHLRELLQGMKLVYMTRLEGTSEPKFAPLVYLPLYILQTFPLNKLSVGELDMLSDVATMCGYTDIVKILLEEDRATVSNNDLINAATYGHLDIVNLLLDSNKGFDASAKNNHALISAIRGGYLDVVNRLLEVPRVVESIHNDGYELADTILEESVTSGNLAIVNRLLETFPEAHTERALAFSAERGYLDIVNRLLNEEEEEAEEYDIMTALKHAAYGGHLNVVNALLQLPGIDPTYNNNELIVWATDGGHIDMVNRLLQYKDVDPTDIGNRALRSAAGGGHLDVVNRLLQDKRVTPEGRNQMLESAARWGQLEVVNRMLKYKNVNPATALLLAVEGRDEDRDYVHIVKRLLKDKRITSKDKKSALRKAKEMYSTNREERYLSYLEIRNLLK